MTEPKVISVVMPGGEVRVEWPAQVADLHLKLALAKLIQLNLANIGTDRALQDIDDLPPPGDVVGFANRRISAQPLKKAAR